MKSLVRHTIASSLFSRRIGRVAILAASILVVMGADRSAESMAAELTRAERELAQQIELDSSIQQLGRPELAEFRRSGPPAERTSRSIVVATEAYPPPSPFVSARSPGAGERAAPPSPRRARVMRYDYATGETIRTIVDLDSRSVLRVRRDKNYPTALAPSEVEDMRRLLAEKVPEVASAVQNAPPEAVEFQYLVPVAVSARAANFGRRVVVTWLQKPLKTQRYVVDLTSGTVQPLK